MEKLKILLKKNKAISSIARYINTNTLLRYKNYKRNKTFLKYGREVLIDFDKACKESHIEYWLEFGTLLGSIREKNFISHDLDIDVGMYLKDYSKDYEKIFNKYGFKRSRYFLVDDGKYGREETYSKNGVDLDIFYFTEKENEMFCHAFANKEGLSWSETIKEIGGLIPREFSFPKMEIAYIDFLDYKFPVPSNYHEHLETNYGNYMMKDKNYTYTKAKNQKVLTNKIGIVSRYE